MPAVKLAFWSIKCNVKHIAHEKSLQCSSEIHWGEKLSQPQSRSFRPKEKWIRVLRTMPLPVWNEKRHPGAKPPICTPNPKVIHIVQEKNQSGIPSVDTSPYPFPCAHPFPDCPFFSFSLNSPKLAIARLWMIRCNEEELKLNLSENKSAEGIGNRRRGNLGVANFMHEFLHAIPFILFDASQTGIDFWKQWRPVENVKAWPTESNQISVQSRKCLNMDCDHVRHLNREQILMLQKMPTVELYLHVFDSVSGIGENPRHWWYLG